MGHTYWEVAAIMPYEWLDTRLKPRKGTKIMQRCRHCGKLRVVTFHEDWGDYADGIYEDVPREKAP